MKKPAVHPYLTLDFWATYFDKNYKPSRIPVRKINLVEPLRSLISYYDWGPFTVGFFQEEDRRRPYFYVFYGDLHFHYQLDFNDIDIFMEFLNAVKTPTRLPLCINFEPAREVIQAALKELC